MIKNIPNKTQQKCILIISNLTALQLIYTANTRLFSLKKLFRMNVDVLM